MRPGEISRAHAGVLFLDEFPLFRSDIIEALRQPLESGDITVARRDESVTLPARGMLVLACNPCPCGNYAVKVGRSQCTCRSQQLRDYRAKLGGPLADRVDITRHIGPVQPHERGGPPAETSASLREQVAAARRRQHERYVDCGWRLNAHVPGSVLRDRWPLDPDVRRAIDTALYDGHLSSRGAVRVHRLALTVADLASVTRGTEVAVGPHEVDTALRLRCGEPLLLEQLSGGVR